MNLKKLTALLLAVLLLVSTLAGCGQKVEDDVEPPLNTIDPAVTDVPPATEPATEPTTSATEPTTEPTTEATTEAPVTTTEPTTVTEPTTKKPDKNDYTVEAMSGTMYATQSLNVRKGPSTEFSKIGALNEGQAVTVTGRASTGWYEIDFNGEKGYVSNVYMTNKAPSEKPVEVTEPNRGDDDDSEYIDEGDNTTTTPSTPSSGTVTAGDWVKDNFADSMFGRFTDDRYKSAMNKLASAVQNLEPYVDLGEYVTHDEAYDIASYLSAMVGTTYCYFDQVTGISGTRLELGYYASSASEAQKMVSALEKQGKKVVKNCSSYSEYNKVKYIYEWIIQNSTYSHSGYYTSSYGPIVAGGASCLGYAKATFYLLSLAGFDCIYGVGKGVNEAHVWVKVNIGGKWYNVDTGWGDPGKPTERDPGYVNYDFLCVTDDYMANTRTSVYNLSRYYSSPAANSDSLNWYRLNDCYAESYDEAVSIMKSQAKAALKGLKSGEYGYARVQMSSMELYQQVYGNYSGKIFRNEILASLTDKGFSSYGMYYEIDEVKKTRSLVFFFQPS